MWKYIKFVTIKLKSYHCGKKFIQDIFEIAFTVLVFIGFYLLGSLSWILESIFDFLDVHGLERMFRDLYRKFFFLLNDRNTVGPVVAIILWIIGTIITELWITTEDID